MRSFLELFSIIFTGLVLGGLLSWFSIQNNHGFGTLTIGQWTAWPLAGSVEADPYSKAKVAADGDVPLGAAEGLAFHAKTDEQGNPLQRNCQYRLEGQTPPARFWTLTAHRLEGDALRTTSGKASHLHSRTLLRRTDGSFELQSGPKLVSGNWLKMNGTGSFEFILRLYDSPITSTSGIVPPFMPSIVRLVCLQ